MSANDLIGQVADIALRNDPPGIDDREPLRYVPNEFKILFDQKHRAVPLCMDAFDDVDDFLDHRGLKSFGRLVEHDMHIVRQIARKVTVLHQGQVLAEGSLAEVVANETVRAVYLGKRKFA